MQTQFFDRLLKVEKAVVRAFKQNHLQATKDVSDNEPASGEPSNHRVTLKMIQSEVGEEDSTAELIDQLAFVVRGSHAEGDQLLELTNFQFADPFLNEPDFASRLVAITLKVAGPSLNDLSEKHNAEGSGEQLVDRLKKYIISLNARCWDHLRLLTVSEKVDSIELRFSSQSHSATLALRKALLEHDDFKGVVNITFEPFLNVKAKPFKFEPAPTSISQTKQETPHLRIADPQSETEMKKQQISQLYQYYNGLLAQDELNSSLGAPKLGNPHHHLQFNGQRETRNLRSRSQGLLNFGSFLAPANQSENVLLLDSSILELSNGNVHPGNGTVTSLERDNKTPLIKSVAASLSTKLDEAPRKQTCYSTKEILKIFKHCGRFQSPLDQPEPYGDQIDLAVLPRLLTKKPQVVLEHLRSHRALPLMMDAGAAVSNKLLTNMRAQLAGLS